MCTNERNLKEGKNRKEKSKPDKPGGRLRDSRGKKQKLQAALVPWGVRNDLEGRGESLIEGKKKRISGGKRLAEIGRGVGKEKSTRPGG